jgi:tetratricopeptide (TPR) repeat protein
MSLGDYEKALAETKESIRLKPDDGFAYNHMALIDLALNRLPEAKTAIEQAAAQKFEDTFVHYSRYQLAFLNRDTPGQQQELGWAHSQPHGEDILLSTQSDTEAYFGRLGEAREFSKRAVSHALNNKRVHPAAIWQINAALREAEFGSPQKARQLIASALAFSPFRDIKVIAALALARHRSKSKKCLPTLRTSGPISGSCRHASASSQEAPERAASIKDDTSKWFSS